jgi:mRNA-degrading endonuclease toxin of MazEF toxin-antitoxin module
MRIAVLKLDETGLEADACLMVDKIDTMPTLGLTKKVGHLSPADLARRAQGIAMLLGFAQ